jgi:hypothetical protein
MPNFSGIWTGRQQLQALGYGIWPSPPGSPTGVSATAGNASAVVSFSAPSNIGYPTTGITGYTVTSSPGGFTGTGASSPITVSGLSNGTAYTFTVRATNSTGTGVASLPSASVTPAAPPSWLFRYFGANDTSPLGVAVDSSSNVYISAQQNIVKTNSVGALQAQNRNNGTFQLSDPGVSYGSNNVVLDSSGNIYFAANGSNSMGAIKYNSSFAVQWSSGIADANSARGSSATDIAISAGESEIYISGIGRYDSCGTTGYPVVLKLNDAGTRQWQYSFRGSTQHIPQWCYGVTVDSGGDPVACGIVRNSSTNVGFIAGLNASTGAFRWQRAITNNSMYDSPSCISTSSYPSGRLNITGTAGDGSGVIAYLMQYNNSGTLQWQKKITLSGATVEGGLNAVDSSGNIYFAIGGSISGSPQFVLLLKFNSSGTLQWQRKITNSSTSTSHYIQPWGGLAVDNVDGTIVLGAKAFLVGATSNSTIAIKYPQDGSITGSYVISSNTYVISASSTTVADGTNTDAAGSMVTTNRTYTATAPSATVTTASNSTALTNL